MIRFGLPLDVVTPNQLEFEDMSMPMTQQRFQIMTADEAKQYRDPEDYVYADDGMGIDSYLVDTELGEVVWCDAMEPEDAILYRSLKPLVDLLNKVADGR